MAMGRVLPPHRVTSEGWVHTLTGVLLTKHRSCCVNYLRLRVERTERFGLITPESGLHHCPVCQRGMFGAVTPGVKDLWGINRVEWGSYEAGFSPFY